MTDERFSKVLVFTPHPDDAEIGCGGSMAKWAASGKEVVLCVVTNGAAGSNDPGVRREDLVARRRTEQREAAAVLGLADVIFLGYEDGAVEDSHDLRRDMIREIRRVRPEVVVGPDPSMWYFEQFYVNHPDHRAVGAAFLAAVNPGVGTVPLYRAELYDRGFLPHAVRACLLAPSLNADFYVDITDHYETKVRSVKAHVSQMAEFPEIDGVLEGKATAAAARAGGGFRFGEGFKALFFGDAPYGLR